MLQMPQLRSYEWVFLTSTDFFEEDGGRTWGCRRGEDASWGGEGRITGRDVTSDAPWRTRKERVILRAE